MTSGSAAAAAAPVSCVAFRADGRRLASGSHGGGVLVQDTSDPARPTKLTELAHRSAVLGAAFNPAATDLLATGSADGTAAVWRVVDDRPPALMKVLNGHPAPVTAVHWMPDGQHLLCQLGDGRAAVWHAFNEAYLGEVGDCLGLDVGPTGLVASVGTSGMVRVRDLAGDPNPLAARQAPAAEACAWTPDGTTLALARRDGTIELRTPQLDPIRTLRSPGVPLRAITWSPDGRYVIAGGYDGTVLTLDTNDRTLWRHTDPAIRPRSLTVAGPAVAVASFGDRPYLLDLFSGGYSRQEAGEPTSPTVSFRDGMVIADGRTVTAGPLAERTVIVEHELPVRAVDALGDRIVVSAAHQAIRLTRLDPQAYEVELGVTLRAPEPVRTVALLGSALATVVVAASYDFRLFAWTVDWAGPPVGPRLAGEFGSGVATLQRLDDQRLTATDHRGELVILALGSDGALSA
ncbi:hypothetical protein AB0J83_46960 [Actinoplanes sp. NPDC049596]|uniref:WD40 repeat domain-containing protein n=1 Tax=unclassified Actinoplanes TaxID=2626549 RepID=UPI00342D22E4